MSFATILLLAVIQGFAELLPVSSSAHVIVAERLLGLDPSSPAMSFLLVMLHTGTMFAVIAYFWPQWRRMFLHAPGSGQMRPRQFALMIVVATGVTGIVGLGLKAVIEKLVLGGGSKAEIEQLFANLPLIAVSLCVAGVMIIYAGRRRFSDGKAELTSSKASLIGLTQGFCLPFRGLSRSGATISTGLFCGMSRAQAESFSFALAVVLTPPVIAREAWRLVKANNGQAVAASLFQPGLVGMVLSFFAGMLALKWLSSWLEKGRWAFFGYYCLVAAAAILVIRFWL